MSQIVVCDSGIIEDKHIGQLAFQIGGLIAEQSHTILTGACDGYPLQAALGAQSKGGYSIGVSPAANQAEHIDSYNKPTQGFNSIIYTDHGYDGRNVTLVRSADAVIIIGGRIGSVMEFTIAYQNYKPIGILSGSGGNSDLLPQIAADGNRAGGKIIISPNPQELVQLVLTELK